MVDDPVKKIFALVISLTFVVPVVLKTISFTVNGGFVPLSVTILNLTIGWLVDSNGSKPKICSVVLDNKAIGPSAVVKLPVNGVGI